MSARCLGLVANTGKEGAAELTRALLDAFQPRGIEVVLERETARLIGQQSDATPKDLGQRCGLLVVLGGDGTMLQVVHELGDTFPPLFGINIGSLGFLTCVGASDHLRAVESIVSQDFRLSERTLLEVEILRRGETAIRCIALNDAVVSRGELSRLIRLAVRIDGAILTEYNADGLIVATPTGSTAYSLSAGGPVMSPDSGVFVITPICPHVLTNRSMIVGDQSLIEISPSPDQEGLFLTVDGQVATRIEPDDVIRLRQSNRRLSLATLPETSFFEVLRQKLKWSGTAV